MLYKCCVRKKFWIDFLYVFAVEAYTASWIEMSFVSETAWARRSRLIQPRGLKCLTYLFQRRHISRGLYSLVDWNIDFERDIPGNAGRGLYSLVDWNFLSDVDCQVSARRGLYSLVDWNIVGAGLFPVISVEAYTASWIEIPQTGNQDIKRQSRLIQPRGLK